MTEFTTEAGRGEDGVQEFRRGVQNAEYEIQKSEFGSREVVRQQTLPLTPTANGEP